MNQYPYPPLLTPCWADLPTEVRGVLWSVAELIESEAGVRTGLLPSQSTWHEKYWVGIHVFTRSGHHLGNLFLHGDRLIWKRAVEPDRDYNLADPDCFGRLVADLKEWYRAFRRSLKGLGGSKLKGGIEVFES